MSFGRLAGRPPAQPIAETSESRGKSSLVGLALFQIVTAGRIVGHLDATCAPFDDPVSVPLTAARTILSGCGLVKNLRPGQQPSETKRSSCFFRAAAHPLEPPAADPDVAGPCPVGARARARDVTTSPCRGDDRDCPVCRCWRRKIPSNHLGRRLEYRLRDRRILGSPRFRFPPH